MELSSFANEHLCVSCREGGQGDFIHARFHLHTVKQVVWQHFIVDFYFYVLFVIVKVENINKGCFFINFCSAYGVGAIVKLRRNVCWRKQPKTVISKEYSSEWTTADEPYYPINNDKNNGLYEQYKALADQTPNVIFGGRLGQYKYYDMDKVIISALEAVKNEFND